MGLPRSDAQRVAKYDAKTQPTTMGLKIAGRLPGMKTDFASFVNTFVDVQLLVRAELGAVATIFPIQYGAYYAYASELWKLTQVTTQPALDAVAQTVADKWNTRGLDCPTLVAIAANVFSITVTCPT